MSILSQILGKQINWAQAKQKIEDWARALTAHDPNLATMAGALMADAKQAASNAIDMGQHALTDHLLPFVKTVEPGLDGVLATYTSGVSIPFNPLINDGVDRIAAAVKAEVDMWSLKAKAALATPAAPK